MSRRLHGWWRRLVPHAVFVGDAAAVAVAMIACALFAPLPRAIASGATDALYLAPVVLATVALMHVGLRVYRPRLHLSALDDLPAFAASTAAVFVVVLAFGSAGEVLVELDGVVVMAVAVGLSLVVVRTVVYAAVRYARRTGVVAHRTVVLGTGPVAQQLAETMLSHPEYGLDPVGFISVGGSSADPDDLPAPVLGTTAELAACVRREGVTEIMLAFVDDSPASPTTITAEVTDEHHDEVIAAVRECDRMDCEIFMVPRFHELHHRTRDMELLWDIPLVRARRASWRSGAWQVKRFLDVVVAAIALVVLAPVMALVALAVLLEVGRPVLFRQVRVGLDEQEFTLLKFRSMPAPGEAARQSAEDAEGHVQLDAVDAVDDTDARVWSVADDPRVGPVGRVIRATSLDELPQLANILRGEMSLVGPRPERPAFVHEFTRAVPRYTARHRAPAGLTGWAQVNGLRGDTSIEERVRFDNFYIQNWSLWFDVKIVVRTIAAVLLRRGS